MRLKVSKYVILVDVWACGVTLYYIISGKLPFDIENQGNIPELYDKIVECRFEVPREANQDIADILEGILRKDPIERLNVDQILNHRWTKGYYHRSALPSILSYMKIDDSESPYDFATPVVQQTVCETTMYPYLSQMFATEIEEKIAKDGCIATLAQDDDFPADGSHVINCITLDCEKKVIDRVAEE